MPNDGLPLGFREQAWNDLSSTQKSKVSLISEWDLNFLIGDLMSRQGVSDRNLHSDAVNELKRFFAIKVLADPHPLGMFGPVVAAAWHAFILHTQQYAKFCQEVYGGIIHHIPGGGSGQDNSRWMSIYREYFGDFPTIWKLDKSGGEVPGIGFRMNIIGEPLALDMDSDDGAFP